MIASKAGIGVAEMGDQYPFPNMDFGWSKHNEEAAQQSDATPAGRKITYRQRFAFMPGLVYKAVSVTGNFYFKFSAVG